MSLKHSVEVGQIKVGVGGVIAILLKSSVSVLVYDRVLEIGGAAHFCFPIRSASSDQSQYAPLHFGDEAVRLLLKEFKLRGSAPQNLIAKIIGGAGSEVGLSNVESARKTLTKFGIKIDKESVGGDFAKKVEFDLSTGEVRCKSLLKEKLNFSSKIKVLIVDDSKSIRMILKRIFASDPRFEVVGEANHPLEAEVLRKKTKPDIMTLDIQMPHQDGVSYLRSITPLEFPVLIITDFEISQGGPVLEAMELGAFHYFQKPSFSEVSELGEKIRETSLIAVEAFRKRQSPRKNKVQKIETPKMKIPSLIVVGSSTGGTEVVKEILMSLPEDAPPVLIVQHMPEHFTKAFAERINMFSKITVKEAAHGDRVESGHAYIAHGGRQLACVEKNGDCYLAVVDDPPMNRFKPSVDYLFQSVLELDLSSEVLAIILTGMGSDGAKGLLALKNRGAYTIGQSEESCLVYGMPRAANEIGATSLMASTEEIVDLISASLSQLKAA